jgi:hypothetical protein
VRNTLHGGGLIFESGRRSCGQAHSLLDQPPHAAGQDEFSSAANTMFTPPDRLWACNTD